MKQDGKLLGVSEESFIGTTGESIIWYRLSFRIGKQMPVTCKATKKAYEMYKDLVDEDCTFELTVDNKSVLKCVG